jgi:hypothetical protein
MQVIAHQEVRRFLGHNITANIELFREKNVPGSWLAKDLFEASNLTENRQSQTPRSCLFRLARSFLPF